MLPVLLLGMYSVPCFAAKTATPTIANGGTADKTAVDLNGAVNPITIELNDKAAVEKLTYAIYYINSKGEKKLVDADSGNRWTAEGYVANTTNTTVTLKQAFFEHVATEMALSQVTEVTVVLTGKDTTNEESDALEIYEGQITPKAVDYTVDVSAAMTKQCDEATWDTEKTNDLEITGVTVSGNTLGEDGNGESHGLYVDTNEADVSDNSKGTALNLGADGFKIEGGKLFLAKDYLGTLKYSDLPRYFSWWNGTEKKLVASLLKAQVVALAPTVAPTFKDGTAKHEEAIEIDTTGDTTADIVFNNIKKEGGATELVLKSSVAGAGEQALTVNVNFEEGDDDSHIKVTILGAALKTLYGKNEGEVDLVIKAYGKNEAGTSAEGLEIVNAKMKAKATTPPAPAKVGAPTIDVNKVYKEDITIGDATAAITIEGITLGANSTGLSLKAKCGEVTRTLKADEFTMTPETASAGETVSVTINSDALKTLYGSSGEEVDFIVTAYGVGAEGTTPDATGVKIVEATMKEAEETPAETTVDKPEIDSSDKVHYYRYDKKRNIWYDSDEEKEDGWYNEEYGACVKIRDVVVDGVTWNVHLGSTNLDVTKPYSATTDPTERKAVYDSAGNSVNFKEALFKEVEALEKTGERRYVYLYGTAIEGTATSVPVLVAQFTVVNGELEASLSEDDFGLAKAEASDYDDPDAVALKIEEVAEGEANVPANAIWSGDISLVDGNGDEIEYDGSIKLALTIRQEDGATWSIGDKVDVYHVANGNAEKIAAGVEIKAVDGDGTVGLVEFTSENGLSPFYIELVSTNDGGDNGDDNDDNGDDNDDKDDDNDDKDDKHGSGAKTKTGDATFALQGLVAMITTGLGLFVMKRKFRK